MRIAFVNTLQELAKKNKDIMLLTNDLGFSVFEKYIEELPKQYLNMGVAEQNMTGVAAGMAMEGKTPFVYSIVPFVTMRNFEQIRNDICYQNLNVKIIGVGAGFSYGPYGHTHHGLEDIGILRTLANLTIICPGDPIEAELAVKKAIKINGPVYIRLGRAGEPIVYSKKPKFTVGKGLIVREGKDITIVSMSYMTIEAIRAAAYLEKQGVSCEIIDLRTIKPIDWETIFTSIHKTKKLMVLDTGVATGSVAGEIIARVSMDHFSVLTQPPVRIALPDNPEPTSFGLTKHYYPGTESIIKSISKMLSIDHDINIVIKSPTLPDVPGDWFKGPF